MNTEDKNKDLNSNNAKPMLGKVNTNAKVLICNNCKDIWIAPKNRCECGCITLTETHESNIVLARNLA